MIGMTIVGALFLYFATDVLLWLEGYFAINSWMQAISKAADAQAEEDWGRWDNDPVRSEKWDRGNAFRRFP
jgi:hypothetical protein